MTTKCTTVFEVVRIDWTGEEETVETFDTLAEAEAFAKQCRREARIERRDSRPKYRVDETIWEREA